MKKARIAELKDHLSRYLDHVKGGGSVLVFDRDQPVAQIVPIQGGRHNTGERGERLGRLERRGIVRRGAGGLPDWLGRRKPPKLRGDRKSTRLNSSHSQISYAVFCFKK